MNEHSVQVVITGGDEQHVRLRVQGAAPDRPLLVQVASLCSTTPSRVEALAGGGRSPAPCVSPAISLELRFREPPPPPAPRSEPAPLATAWALAQRLRQRKVAPR